ncbi:MAG: DnaJ domain-containing protein [Proteobacteria bacterium]|nr:DnaJ domain-containing protein [Pseudomonadota bacterium]
MIDRQTALQRLGFSVTSNPTEESIKKAFRNKAKLVHPDKNPSPEANAEFIGLSEAFQFLIKPSIPHDLQQPQNFSNDFSDLFNDFINQFFNMDNFFGPSRETPYSIYMSTIKTVVTENNREKIKVSAPWDIEDEQDLKTRCQQQLSNINKLVIGNNYTLPPQGAQIILDALLANKKLEKVDYPTDFFTREQKFKLENHLKVRLRKMRKTLMYYRFFRFMLAGGLLGLGARLIAKYFGIIGFIASPWNIAFGIILGSAAGAFYEILYLQYAKSFYKTPDKVSNLSPSEQKAFQAGFRTKDYNRVIESFFIKETYFHPLIFAAGISMKYAPEFLAIKKQIKDEIRNKAKAKAEVEVKAKIESETKAKAEAEVKAKVEAEAKAKIEAEAKAKVEAEANAVLDKGQKITPNMELAENKIPENTIFVEIASISKTGNLTNYSNYSAGLKFTNKEELDDVLNNNLRLFIFAPNFKQVLTPQGAEILVRSLLACKKLRAIGIPDEFLTQDQKERLKQFAIKNDQAFLAKQARQAGGKWKLKISKISWAAAAGIFTGGLSYLFATTLGLSLLYIASTAYIAYSIRDILYLNSKKHYQSKKDIINCSSAEKVSLKGGAETSLRGYVGSFLQWQTYRHPCAYYAAKNHVFEKNNNKVRLIRTI